MNRTLDLSLLSRKQLEDLLLTEHGALTKVLQAVREKAKPDWSVTRAVEKIVAEATDARPFLVAYTRSVGSVVEERDAANLARRNEAQWTRFREGVG